MAIQNIWTPIVGGFLQPGDVDAVGLSARLRGPGGLECGNAAGDFLYLADTFNNALKKINLNPALGPRYQVTTLVPGSSGLLNRPFNMYVHPISGNVYIVSFGPGLGLNFGEGFISKYVPGGSCTTIITSQVGAGGSRPQIPSGVYVNDAETFAWVGDESYNDDTGNDSIIKMSLSTGLKVNVSPTFTGNGQWQDEPGFSGFARPGLMKKALAGTLAGHIFYLYDYTHARFDVNNWPGGLHSGPETYPDSSTTWWWERRYNVSSSDLISFDFEKPIGINPGYQRVVICRGGGVGLNEIMIVGLPYTQQVYDGSVDKAAPVAMQTIGEIIKPQGGGSPAGNAGKDPFAPQGVAWTPDGNIYVTDGSLFNSSWYFGHTDWLGHDTGTNHQIFVQFRTGRLPLRQRQRTDSLSVGSMRRSKGSKNFPRTKQFSTRRANFNTHL